MDRLKRRVDERAHVEIACGMASALPVRLRHMKHRSIGGGRWNSLTTEQVLAIR